MQVFKFIFLAQVDGISFALFWFLFRTLGQNYTAQADEIHMPLRALVHEILT